MSNTEAIAYNYFSIIEEKGINELSPELYRSYLEMLEQLTGKVIPYRKGCKNRIRKAHHFYSDYFFNKLK